MNLFGREKDGNRVIYKIFGIKFTLTKKLKRNLGKIPHYNSYSQIGEDVMLRGFIEEKWNDFNYQGFYVDIGAHHPHRLSNTMMYYEHGWRGITIEPMPDVAGEFRKMRPDDIHLTTGIGPKEETLEYYTFSEPAVNTFSKEFAQKFIDGEVPNCKFLGVRDIPVMPLSSVLDKNLAQGQHIDFFTIDTEGLDLAILQTNNWEKYSPDYILIEIHTEGGILDIPNGEVAGFLKEKGYQYVAQAMYTSMFKKI